MEEIPRHKDPEVIEAPEGFGEDELLSGLLLSGMPRPRPAVPPSEEAEQRALEQSQVLRQDPQRPRYPLRGASAQQVGQGMLSCACKPCEPASGDPVHFSGDVVLGSAIARELRDSGELQNSIEVTV